MHQESFQFIDYLGLWIIPGDGLLQFVLLKTTRYDSPLDAKTDCRFIL